MFDIGFSELVLIMIVGLVVLGPKRMPIAIRTVMGWVSTIRGLAANVQNELAQELKLQELKESIKKAEELNISSLSPELSKTVEDLKMSATQLQDSLNSAKNDFENSAATKANSVPKLTDEQVAEIQQKIEQESEVLEQIQQLQENAENRPLDVDKSDNLAEQLNVVVEKAELSPDEIAEQAEMDESLVTLESYYPPDDDFAAVESEPKAEGKNGRS